MATLDVLVDGIDFGEGPRWHEGRLWYSDFFQHAVYAVTPDGVRERIVEVPQQPSGLGWLPDGRLLVVSMLDRRVLRLEGGALVEHADLSAVATGPCNDMVVSASGHAYVGNFGAASSDGSPVAALAHVTPDGHVEAAAAGLRFPNGSVITPDGATLMVAETAGGCVSAFELRADGSLGERRVWAAVEGSGPDGCTLDAGGGLWFADARGQCVVRVLEGGRVTDSVETGAGTYACMLGGEDGRTLYILTAPGFSAEGCAGKAAGRILQLRVEAPRAGLP
ncbi:MAG: SMP-30/gluconolactonase/LRE family protein [Chloroflexi bacterium]|nr:SMP-30/gluconolactonase/LRE family protein [Chloroflexota bacterium]